MRGAQPVFKAGIVPGARITSHVTDERGAEFWAPSPHLSLRIDAAQVAFEQGLVEFWMLTGGHNVGVRYNTNQILNPPDFSRDAIGAAYGYPSEAQIMSRWMNRVPRNRKMQESVSATTAENAQILKIILQRTPAFEDVRGPEDLCLMTQLYHMGPALAQFRDAGVPLKPLLVEDVLWGTEYWGLVVSYYKDRKERTGATFPDIPEFLALMEERGSALSLLAPAIRAEGPRGS